MRPRERVWTVLRRQVPDRVPRFEIWIDGLLSELGQPDPVAIYPHLGQDCLLLPGGRLPGSLAWRTGVDEWGCRWLNGSYLGGVVKDWDDLARYSPPVALAVQTFDGRLVETARSRFPHHCHIFGTHIGPFTAAYMAMGPEAFFLRLADAPSFVQALLEQRTDWLHRRISPGAGLWAPRCWCWGTMPPAAMGR